LFQGFFIPNILYVLTKGYWLILEFLLHEKCIHTHTAAPSLTLFGINEEEKEKKITKENHRSFLGT